MEQNHFKTWKLVTVFAVIFSLFIYILFIVAFTKNVEIDKQRALNTITAFKTEVQQPTFTLKLTLQLLLQPNSRLLDGRVFLVINDNSDTVELLPFSRVASQSILDVLVPTIALFFISITAFIVSAFLQANRINKRVKPLCEQANEIVCTYQLDEKQSHFKRRPSLTQLEYQLNRLKDLANDYRMEVEQSVFCDKLTKLVDRHTFLEHINKQIRISGDKEKKGMLFIDLDGFKQVNDSFGHSFGDEILIQVAERLKSIVRRQELNFKQDENELEYNLARLGGDEFTIFIQHIDKPEKATNIAKHILKELERDFVLGNKTIKISASIGMAIYPDSAATPNTLVQMADVAMYRAKSDGRGIYRIYSPEMGTKMRRYHYLLDEMRLALDSDNFFLTFQPIIHVDGCTISYFEALARWQHPVEGTISPAEFIPIAEDSNLILELGDWILDEACRQMAAWYNAGMKNARISVNVSGIQLKHKPIYQWIMQAVNKMGLPASSLMIEVTESCFIDASEDIISELEKLRKEGIAIAIDDFGTGFSSLAILANLPVDVLKIDKLFITEAMINQKYDKILRSIVEMAAQLELKVVAEGIEQVEQLELLKSIGVVYIQGYLISRPQRSNYVGNKVLGENNNIMAQLGTGTWSPQPSRVIGSVKH